MSIYTNQTALKSLRAIFQKKSNSVSSINIASAFFNCDDIVSNLSARGIIVNLIVRLSEATPPESLKKIYKLPNVTVRYYTSKRFHPKLYIFGEDSAIVGSANFTGSGFNSNSEVCIEVLAGSDDFDDLAYVFQDYWDQANALTDDDMRKYEALHANNKPRSKAESLEDNIQNTFGGSAPSSEIIKGGKKKDKKTLFTADYERTYQVFEKSYRVVERIYKDIGKRKVPEDYLPLRIEIDQFFNFVRSKFTVGESYNEAPIRTGEDLENFIASKISEWLTEEWSYLQTITANYKKIIARFPSEEAIAALSIEEIFEGLDVCHAFHEQLRFHQGGMTTFKKAFMRESNEVKLKEALTYLLYGSGRYVERMANCIFGTHKVDFLSRYSIQELLGWVNEEDIPICNTRTLKALRYLGAISSAIPSISRTHGLELKEDA
jgi:hypothetical protein